MRLSKIQEAAVRAHRKGYRVVGNEVISPYSGKARKLIKHMVTDNYFFLQFTVGGSSNGRTYTRVHLLAAYQKYGLDAFKPEIVVRHLDGDPSNNTESNIAIGTRSDNMMDRDPKEREAHSIKASTYIRKFTDMEMEEIRKFHSGSYKETMETFDVCKGTLHRILNVEYKTKV